RVGIPSAEAELIHRGTASVAATWPGPAAIDHGEAACGHVEARIRSAVIEACRNLFVPQGQGDLDEGCHSGCGVQMTDIRLDRTDTARRCPRAAPIGLSERRKLNGIADRRAGAVRLDVGDGCPLHLPDPPPPPRPLRL